MPIKNKRNATERPPYIVVIKPDGHFYRSPIASNINDSIVGVDNGKPTIRAAAAEKGYVFLKDGADSPAQARMLHTYFEREDAEGKLIPIPEKHLPKLCLERRGKAELAGHVDFDEMMRDAAGAGAGDDAPARWDASSNKAALELAARARGVPVEGLTRAQIIEALKARDALSED